MEIKRRTDYAIRMMLSIAKHGNQSPLSINQISKSDDVPYQFARSIQHDLVQAGLLKTIRGAHGGSMLAKPADQISLFDVVATMQGPPVFSPCELDPSWCQRFGVCSVHEVWHQLDVEIRTRLQAISLDYLVRNLKDVNLCFQGKVLDSVEKVTAEA
ncbi:MAG: Rrf2 family transcriptional regulator [Actinomycetia bacterium]|nr:Rrf2 family transcriptional regulator [Actinomycetes bacterium]